jgi:RNA polymerase sigma-70 factor (ECF subfamily)
LKFPAPEEVDQLFHKVQQGDLQAFSRYFEIFYPRLYTTGTSICPRNDLLEEVIQDVFIYIWENRKNLNIRRHETYLFVLLRNRLYRQFNKSWPEFTSADELVNLQSEPENTEEEMFDQQLKQARRILSILPESCRTIFLMHRVQSLKYREIAELLNISHKTVENQMGKALKIILSYTNRPRKSHSKIKDD